MSQENVEVVRTAYEAFARGDGDAALRDLDPEVEVHPPRPRRATVGFFVRKAGRHRKP